jgi:DNA mismatch endonuclease (patch repair protein)
MTDSTKVTASSDAVKQRMSRQASHDTQPELLLRRILHRQGLRYRVHLRPERGIRRQADIVFTRAKVAVFVDGCFWHRCPEHGTEPKANSVWWKAKLDRNSERDRETDQALVAAGWTVIRVWEHEDPVEAAARVKAALQSVGGIAAAELPV